MKKLSLTSLAMAGVAFLSLAVTAQANSFVMTEVSSTELTYSLNGGTTQTVTATTPYSWTLNFENNAIVTGTAIGTPAEIFIAWEEPDYATSGMINLIEFYEYETQNGTTVTITGCAETNPEFPPPLLANGATYTFDYSDAYTATFTSDVNCDPVPDGGATVGLLGLGLVGLGLMSKWLARA
jgi:hypothetical protein